MKKLLLVASISFLGLCAGCTVLAIVIGTLGSLGEKLESRKPTTTVHDVSSGNPDRQPPTLSGLGSKWLNRLTAAIESERHGEAGDACAGIQNRESLEKLPEPDVSILAEICRGARTANWKLARSVIAKYGWDIKPPVIRPPSSYKPARQSEPAYPNSTSSTCGSIEGHTKKDLDNVRRFCAQVVPGNGSVVGANATEMLLWIKVSRQMAVAMNADPLSTKQLVLTWMKAWRASGDHMSVTVMIEWNDVEIARGQTSWGRDEVEIR